MRLSRPSAENAQHAPQLRQRFAASCGSVVPIMKLVVGICARHRWPRQSRSSGSAFPSVPDAGGRCGHRNESLANSKPLNQSLKRKRSSFFAYASGSDNT